MLCAYTAVFTKLLKPGGLVRTTVASEINQQAF